MKARWAETLFRSVVAAAFWLGIAGVLASPVFLSTRAEGCRHGLRTRGDPIELTLDRRGTMVVPQGWFWTQSRPGEHFVLGAAVSNDPCAVAGLVRQTGSTLRVRAIERSRLRPDAGFVSVYATYFPSPDEPMPRLPVHLDPRDFDSGARIYGEPVRSLQGGSVDWYAVQNVIYWVGPSASDDTKRAVRRAIESLHLR